MHPVKKNLLIFSQFPNMASMAGSSNVPSYRHIRVWFFRRPCPFPVVLEENSMFISETNLPRLEKGDLLTEVKKVRIIYD